MALQLQRKLYVSNGDIIHRHLAIVAESLLADITGTRLNDADIQELRNYLFSVESWNKYELILFTATVGQLREPLIISFGNALIKNVKDQSVITLYEELIESCFSNIVLTLLRKNNVDEATHFLNALPTMISNSTHFEIINRIHYLDGLIHIGRHETAQGLAIAQQAIEIIAVLGSKTVASDYQNYLGTVLAVYK